MILGIETSCDETSASVVHDGVILSNVVSSQIKLHQPFGGVVPEVASRQHLRLIDSIIAQAVEQAKLESPAKLDAIAVTRGPGLPSALLVGVAAARGVALSLQKPLIPIHHMEGHLYSAPCGDEPFIALIVSGGHTMLVHVAKPGQHRVLGQTVDDASGEAFDKAARLLGLPYPGGPEIEKAARAGNARAFDFPRPMLTSPDWNFSFSGLKTALRRAVTGLSSPLNSTQVADLCASFQTAVTDVLVAKTIRAAREHRVKKISVSGGVACNGFLREQMIKAGGEAGFEVLFAERKLCTDNGAMIALWGEQKWKAGYQSDSSWDIEPDWKL
jgi:N6-L-threonylcarbamoyladenine synthase